jgi:hypothetical protein
VKRMPIRRRIRWTTIMILRKKVGKPTDDVSGPIGFFKKT